MVGFVQVLVTVREGGGGLLYSFCLLLQSPCFFPGTHRNCCKRMEELEACLGEEDREPVSTRKMPSDKDLRDSAIGKNVVYV